MIVYITCHQCGTDDIPQDEMRWHECATETDGYDPAEPSWMDNNDFG